MEWVDAISAESINIFKGRVDRFMRKNGGDL